jgi:hypothetical protein
MTLVEAAVKDGQFRGLSETLSQVRVLKQIKNLTELGPESWERISNRAGATETPRVSGSPQFIAVPREYLLRTIDAAAEVGDTELAAVLDRLLEVAR